MSQPDNTIGEPIFQPELTGDRLRDQDAIDWFEFCGKLVDHNSKFYNTWMENRWRRADKKAGGQGRDRKDSAVKAEAHHGAIYIRCPSKAWAHHMREAMTTDIRGLTHRKLIILAPGGRPKKPVTEAEKLAAEEILRQYQARKGVQPILEEF